MPRSIRGCAMTDQATTLDLRLAQAPTGRSLTRLALQRLLRNRAAVASIVTLLVIAALSIIGPYVTPHAYDQVFTSYVRVPPSLEPYPLPSTLRQVMESAAAQGRVTLSAFDVQGSSFTATLTSDMPIDPRTTRYVDRADEFDDTMVVGTRDDGKTLLVSGTVHREFFLMGTDGNGRDLFARIMIGGRISLTVGLLATLVALAIGVAYGAISGFLGGRVDNIMMRLVEIFYALPFVFLVI